MSKNKSKAVNKGFGAPPNLGKRLGRMRQQAGVTTHKETPKRYRKGWKLAPLHGLRSSYLYKKWDSLNTKQCFNEWVADNFPKLYNSYRGDINP